MVGVYKAGEGCSSVRPSRLFFHPKAKAKKKRRRLKEKVGEGGKTLPKKFGKEN